MNYEQKHQEDLEAAKGWLAIAKENNNTIAIQILEKFFPELRESEDERIREEIIEYLKQRSKSGFNQEVKICNNGIAWLEKQGEQKPIDMIEPKFHEGEWVVNRFGDVWHIDSFDGKSYQVSNGDKHCYFPIERQGEMHLWTIQDVKDGDVLAYPDGTIVIFKYRLDGLNSGIYMSHILLTTKIEISQSCAVSKDIHPATKEQRDLLFQKMKEAGYEWNAEKKELKKN